MIPEIFTSDPSWPYTKAKTAVLTAASAVIREDGPRAATLKNIATRAGITEPAIFRHFDGVDGLFGGLFSVYERIYGRSTAAFSNGEQGLARLRTASSALVETIAASREFAYILVNARHVFREYSELKLAVAQNDAKDQAQVLACINEAIKSGQVRGDVDPVSVAVSLLGGISVTTTIWIESNFGFDIQAAFEDRWDDFERMVAAKPVAKSRESKSSIRERSASYFPLRPAQIAKGRSGAAKKGVEKPKPVARKPKVAAKAVKPKTGKQAKQPEKRSPKATAGRAAKLPVRKPSTRSK